MLIRSANINDASEILEIYRPSIEKTPASFETTVPVLSEMENRMREVQLKFPWIVGEIDKVIVGYAYASTHRSRCAYEWSVESTIYMHEKFQGKGLGFILYKKLFDILKQQGVVNIFAGITLPNDGSVKLHERMGFVKVANFKDIGFKLNQWWDVGWWQLQLQKPEVPQKLGPYVGI